MGKEQHYFVVLNLSQDVTLRLKIIRWIVTLMRESTYFPWLSLCFGKK